MKFACYSLLIFASLFHQCQTRGGRGGGRGGSYSSSSSKNSKGTTYVPKGSVIAVALGGSSDPSKVTRVQLGKNVTFKYLSQYKRTYYYGGFDDDVLIPSSAVMCGYDITKPDKYFDLYFYDQTRVVDIDYLCNKSGEFCCDNLDCCPNCTTITCNGNKQQCCSDFEVCCPSKVWAWWTYVIIGIIAFVLIMICVLCLRKCHQRRSQMWQIQTVQVMQLMPQKGAMMPPGGWQSSMMIPPGGQPGMMMPPGEQPAMMVPPGGGPTLMTQQDAMMMPPSSQTQPIIGQNFGLQKPHV